MAKPVATQIRIGCAGWSIPASQAETFAPSGSHLERYASRLNAVEINSTFYKPHRQTTYERWAQATPNDFQFSVKIPKSVTHQKKLNDVSSDLITFLANTQGLKDKLNVWLVQLPPTLEFDSDIVSRFFETFRNHSTRNIVCEPRHKSWFTDAANKLLERFHIARVAADPAIVPEAAEPSGWRQVAYYRLHGSPRKYYSSYDSNFLANLSHRLQHESNAQETWCIFDNTASGAAIENAIALSSQIAASDNMTASHRKHPSK